MIKNRYVALVYRFFCFFVTLSGLLVQMDVFRGRINLKHFMYYTIQSNLLALVLFGLLIYKTFVGIRKSGKTGNAGYIPRFEMVCVVDLLLTLIVYWVILAPGSFAMDKEMGLLSYGNLAVHLFVPLLVAIDYFLFSPPGHLKYRDVFYVTIFPLCYVLFTSIAGFLGYVYRINSADGRPVHFPYFFFDWHVVGVRGLLNILGLAIVFLAMSHLLYGIDKMRAKKQKPNSFS